MNSLLKKENIFILEDDTQFCDYLVDLFKEEYNVYKFESCNQLASFPLNKIDLFLLDWDLKQSHKTGQDFCYYLKKELKTSAPVIMLTGRIDPESLELGLNSGAVDYITKPTNLDLLKIKVKNHLLYKNNISSPYIEYKGISLDYEKNEVKFNGEEIKLSKKPFLILFNMIQEPHRIFSRKDLNNIINEGITVSNRNVDTHVVNLRSKFKPLKIIKTVHGFGYQINL